MHLTGLCLKEDDNIIIDSKHFDIEVWVASI